MRKANNHFHSRLFKLEVCITIHTNTSYSCDLSVARRTHSPSQQSCSMPILLQVWCWICWKGSGSGLWRGSPSMTTAWGAPRIGQCTTSCFHSRHATSSTGHQQSPHCHHTWFFSGLNHTAQLPDYILVVHQRTQGGGTQQAVCHFIAANHLEDHNKEFVEQAWRSLLDPTTGKWHHLSFPILTLYCRTTSWLQDLWSVVRWWTTSLQEQECYLHVVSAHARFQGMLSLIDVTDTPTGRVLSQHVCSIPWLEPLRHSCITIQVPLQQDPAQQGYDHWHTTSLPCCCGWSGRTLSSHSSTYPTRKQGSCGRTGWNSRHLLLLSIWRWHLHGLQEIPWSQTSTTVSHQHQQQSNTRRAPQTHCLLHSNNVKHILSTKPLSFFIPSNSSTVLFPPHPTKYHLSLWLEYVSI